MKYKIIFSLFSLFSIFTYQSYGQNSYQNSCLDILDSNVKFKLEFYYLDCYVNIYTESGFLLFSNVLESDIKRIKQLKNFKSYIIVNNITGTIKIIEINEEEQEQ